MYDRSRYCYVIGSSKRRGDGGGQIFVPKTSPPPATVVREPALRPTRRSAGNKDTVNDKTVSKRPTRVRPLMGNRPRTGRTTASAFTIASVCYAASNYSHINIKPPPPVHDNIYRVSIVRYVRAGSIRSTFCARETCVQCTVHAAQRRCKCA